MLPIAITDLSHHAVKHLDEAARHPLQSLIDLIFA
jgi:hypothetical protein